MAPTADHRSLAGTVPVVTDSLDAIERRELCDLFAELGPDAPTLCEGWTTLDLAAHLVVREHDLRGGPGIVLGDRVPALGKLTADAMDRARRRGYDTLVDTIRGGPPLGIFRVPGLGPILNTTEYFVHHEDVRRANGLAPRTDRPDLDDALWSALGRNARLMVRSVRAGVDLVWHGRDRVIHARRGVPLVRVIGTPQELVLELYGRRSAARIELDGDEQAKAAFRNAELGI